MNHLSDSRLNEYLDHAVDESTSLAMNFHIATCEHCRTRLVEMERLFDSLEDLSEINLPRDFASSIMAQLPARKPGALNPSIAAQAGVALGALFWLAMQTSDLILSMLIKLERLELTQFKILVFHITWPNLEPPNLYSLSTSLFSFLSALHFSSISSLFSFHFPNLSFRFPDLLLISASTSILWLVGNLSLLRGHLGVQK